MRSNESNIYNIAISDFDTRNVLELAEKRRTVRVKIGGQGDNDAGVDHFANGRRDELENVGRRWQNHAHAAALSHKMLDWKVI